jgi:ankyrin repeat protein
LEVLRHCFPTNLRRTLEELPESLDKTYERILKGIHEANRKPALRLLQCLTVAAQPLRVEELAEVLAIDFDAGGTNTGWRWEDQKDAVLSACSSLVSVITDGADQVVQFSHFSVKEFLTSGRLANSELSQFHISLEPAHAILAHACLSVLLRLDEHTDRDSFKTDPLLPYAAECWVKHAQFKDVESRTEIKDAMDSFFDAEKPHFSAWVRIQRLHDLLEVPADSETHMVPSAAPLYFAAYCGLRGLVERMIVKHPEHVSACSEECGTPLHSSILGGHIDAAKLLLAHGADVNAPDTYSVRPLHVASRHGHLDAAKWLLDHGADVNARRVDGQTALHSAALKGHLDVARMLLEHNADVGARDVEGSTPLSLALEGVDGGLDVVRLLLDSNADVDTRDNSGKTPLHYAAADGHLKVTQLLLQRNAECNAQDDQGYTPLRCASEAAELGLMRLLLDRGADADACDNSGNTPLHQAAVNTLVEVARILLVYAEVNARNDCGSTPLHLAAEEGELDVVSLLLDCGADVHVRDNSGNTPLHIASTNGHRGVVQILLDREVEADAQSDHRSTPSHLTSEELEDFGAVCALLDRFAVAQVRDNGVKGASESTSDWEQQRFEGLLSAEMNG